MANVVPEVAVLFGGGKVGSHSRGCGAFVELLHVAILVASVASLGRAAARRLGALGRAGGRGAARGRGRVGAFAVVPEARWQMGVNAHIALGLGVLIAVRINALDAIVIPAVGRPTVHALAVRVDLAMFQARVGAGRRLFRVPGQARVGARGRLVGRLGRVCTSQYLLDILLAEGTFDGALVGVHSGCLEVKAGARSGCIGS